MSDPSLRLVQDQAYEEGLLQDRRLMERREEEEEQNAMREALELSRIEAEERHLRELTASVPPEPPAGGADVCALALRLPDGTRVQRRLLRSDTIGLLRRVVAAQRSSGVSVPARFAIVMDYPRRRFDDDAQTLESAGMWPRAAINIVEVDDDTL